MASDSSQRTTQIASQAVGERRLEQLDHLDHRHRDVAHVELGQSRADLVAHPGMENRLELAERGAVVEHDPSQRRGVRRPEAALDGGAHLGVVVPQLARHGVGVDDRRAEVVEHPRHGALAAADVAGQADDDHRAPSSSGRRWQRGQKCVLRWPTTIRSIGRPQRRHGSPGPLVDAQPLGVPAGLAVAAHVVADARAAVRRSPRAARRESRGGGDGPRRGERVGACAAGAAASRHSASSA